MKLTKKLPWLTVSILSILIGFYPLIYFLIDRQFGLLQFKSTDLLNNSLWNIGFYGHIILGGLALLIGWMQFSQKLRTQRLSLHRKIGKVYVIAVIISGICGLYIALFATGGLVSTIGFLSLAVIWLVSTMLSFIAIKNGRINRHESLMIFSYAACFSAVTLRVWLPILSVIFEDFVLAYRLVAWLCWVPNIIVAFFLIKRKRKLKI